MPSYYSVVQYVPDPISDERVNVGILVFGDGRIRSRFLANWRRVSLFGGEDVTFIRELAERASVWTPEELELPGLEQGMRLDEGKVSRLLGRWENSIQFTEPRTSTLSPEELLDEVGARMLKQPERMRRGFRDRRVAASLARRTLRQALEEAVGETWGRLYRQNEPVAGNLDEHVFDVALANGTPILAAQGLSFEGPHTRMLEKEVDSTAWAVTDVRERDPKMRLAVVVLPPKSKSKTYERARRIFDGLQASVVQEDEADSWARLAVSGVS